MDNDKEKSSLNQSINGSCLMYRGFLLMEEERNRNTFQADQLINGGSYSDSDVTENTYPYLEPEFAANEFTYPDLDVSTYEEVEPGFVRNDNEVMYPTLHTPKNELEDIDHEVPNSECSYSGSDIREDDFVFMEYPSEEELYENSYLPSAPPLASNGTSQAIVSFSNGYSAYASSYSRVLAGAVCHYAMITANAVFNSKNLETSEEWIGIISDCLKNSAEYARYAHQIYKNSEFTQKLYEALEDYWNMAKEIEFGGIGEKLTDISHIIDSVVKNFASQKQIEQLTDSDPDWVFVQEKGKDILEEVEEVEVCVEEDVLEEEVIQKKEEKFVSTNEEESSSEEMLASIEFDLCQDKKHEELEEKYNAESIENQEYIFQMMDDQSNIEAYRHINELLQEDPENELYLRCKERSLEVLAGIFIDHVKELLLNRNGIKMHDQWRYALVMTLKQNIIYREHLESICTVQYEKKFANFLNNTYGRLICKSESGTNKNGCQADGYSKSEVYNFVDHIVNKAMLPSFAKELSRSEQVEATSAIVPYHSNRMHLFAVDVNNNKDVLKGMLLEKKEHFAQIIKEFMMGAYNDSNALSTGRLKKIDDQYDVVLNNINAINYVSAPYSGGKSPLTVMIAISGLNRIRTFNQKSIAERIKRLAIDAKEMESILEEIIDIVAYKYEEQILKLDSKGVAMLAECVCGRMINYCSQNSSFLGSMCTVAADGIAHLTKSALRSVSKELAPEAHSNIEWKKHLLDGVYFGECLLDGKELAVQNNGERQRWIISKILTCSGLHDEVNDAYYKNADCCVEKYGWHRGEKEDAKLLGFREVMTDFAENSHYRLKN